MLSALRLRLLSLVFVLLIGPWQATTHANNNAQPLPPETFAHPYGEAWAQRRFAPIAPEAVKEVQAALAATRNQPSAPTNFAFEHRMAFESFRDGNYEIYVADGDGNGVTRLTNNSAPDRFPKLRFGAIDVGYVIGDAGSRAPAVIRKDGSGSSTLLGGAGYSDIAWSPNSTRAAYALRGTNTTDVYIASFDSAVRQFANALCLTCNSGRNNFEPTWSPDGTEIIFIRASATEPRGAIWRMNADGTNQRPLTGELWWISDLGWSPDGTRVAYDFAPERSAWQRLGMLTLANNSMREIYNPNQDRVEAYMGTWSPDSQQLFFTRYEYVMQNNQLFIDKSYIERVPAIGGAKTRLPGNSGLDSFPSLQKRDLVAPVSEAQKLPPYIHSAGFTGPKVISSDVGDSGIAMVSIEWKEGLAGNWQVTNTPAHGTIIYFRSIAHDFEGNVEEPPNSPTGDTSTTFYGGLLTGYVKDNRGYALPNVSIDVDPLPLFPATTQPNGSYRVLLVRELKTFNVSKPPFAPIPQTFLTGFPSNTQNAYLFATDNVVKNGSFENTNSFDQQPIVHWHRNDGVGTTFRRYLGMTSAWFLKSNTSLTQVVTMPLTMHRPTLTFAYQIGNFLPLGQKSMSETVNVPSSDAPLFVVKVSEDVSTTVVFSANAPISWTVNTVDMNAWSGKTITLGFFLISGPLQANLDDVSLSSWLTPVPTRTSITQLPIAAPAQTITITGTNFIATPTVKLNGTLPLGDVVWLSESELQATLPANLPVGIHDLWVTNPGGQESVLPSAIRVGLHMFLPLVARTE